MPSCLSPCLQLLGFRRSRPHLPQPHPANDRDATGVSDSSGPVRPPVSSSRPSSILRVPEPRVNAATGTSCLLSPEKTSNTQITTEHRIDESSDTSQLAGASLSLPPSSLVPSKSAQMANPHSSVIQQPTRLVCPSSPAPPIQGQQLLVQSSQQSLNSQRENQGLFNHARDFSVTGNFVDISSNMGNVTLTNNINAPNKFMKELLKETIPGAAFDSSARDPPPRCHPGTRLAILKRCVDFVANSSGTKKIRWIVGAAGVGKSAIMQNVAESPLPITSHASVFFSFNGRSDGTKTFITLGYQLAAKSEPYRLFVENEIDRDPSLLHASMSVQFKKFFVEPFILNPSLSSAGRVLIVLDGLDECDNPRTQQELLRLISDFCTTYPSSPVVWLIASRPEQHITSFFSKRKVIPTYEKEEILVDSDEARADVERYLRHELAEIKDASDSLDPDAEWPQERDLWKLANASGGLFAYAETVVRYIGDSIIGNPALQLSDVLNVIDNHPIPDTLREQHPLALLDALYTRILSNVPPKVLINTRKVLLALSTDWGSSVYERESNFVVLCNWLGITPDEAYAAINHLRSVLRVPRREKAHEEGLKPFHKSFIDFISDFTRSSFSEDIKREAGKFKIQYAFRILKEAPDGIDFGDAHYALGHGRLMRGPGTGDKISLTWQVDEKDDWDNNGTRLSVYKLALGKVADGMKNRDPDFQNAFCIRLLTTRFEIYRKFPHYELSDLVFDESRRDEFMKNGILKQTPIKVVHLRTLFNQINLQFRCRATRMTDPWDPSCKHEREGVWEGKNKNWTTAFRRTVCTFCFDRLERQLENSKTKSPDHSIPVLFSSTGDCCIELRFVDQTAGAPVWRYWCWINLSPEERKKWGSDI